MERSPKLSIYRLRQEPARSPLKVSKLQHRESESTAHNRLSSTLYTIQESLTSQMSCRVSRLITFDHALRSAAARTVSYSQRHTVVQ